jgi:hypothetical protein
MSYVSLLKNIPEILSQPTGIAALASVGIHGAIALIVPLMPVDSEQSQNTTSPRSVGILELSQADQNRLPQIPGTSQSPVALQPQLPVQPGFPLQSQLPIQPPNLPPNLNIQTLPPSLDTQRAVLAPLPPPLYTQPPLPPIVSRQNAYRTPYTSPTATLPERQPTPTTSQPELQFDTSGFNAAEQKFTASAPTFNTDEIQIAAQPVPVNKLPELPAAERPSNLPNIPPPVTASAPTPQASQPSSNNAAQIAKRQEDLIARIQRTPQAGDDLKLAEESIPKWQQGDAPQRPELPLPQVNEPQSQPTLVAKLNSYEDLRTAIQQQYPNSVQKAVIRETINTDKPNAEGTVSGFLVVDTDGKVLDIKFQDNSAPELQVKTRQYFTAKAPKASQEISSYPFNLRFENNGNAAVTTQQQPPTAVKPAPTPANTQNITEPSESTSVVIPQTPPAKDSQPTSVVIPQTSPAEETQNNQESSSNEPSQQLIQKLRQAREER